MLRRRRDRVVSLHASLDDSGRRSAPLHGPAAASPVMRTASAAGGGADASRASRLSPPFRECSRSPRRRGACEVRVGFLHAFVVDVLGGAFELGPCRFGKQPRDRLEDESVRDQARFEFLNALRGVVHGGSVIGGFEGWRWPQRCCPVGSGRAKHRRRRRRTASVRRPGETKVRRRSQVSPGRSPRRRSLAKISQMAMNMAAMTGPMTNPLMPATARPPIVETSTT